MALSNLSAAFGSSVNLPWSVGVQSVGSKSVGSKTVPAPHVAPVARQAVTRKMVRTPDHDWDLATAQQQVLEVLTRLGQICPVEYDFTGDEATWKRLDAQLERAFSRHNCRQLEVALSKYEATACQLFEEFVENVLNAPEVGLDDWFAGLPVG